MFLMYHEDILLSELPEMLIVITGHFHDFMIVIIHEVSGMHSRAGVIVCHVIGNSISIEFIF